MDASLDECLSADNGDEEAGMKEVVKFQCSPTLEYESSVPGEDLASPTESTNALDMSQQRAMCRDGALAMILRQEYSKALRKLKVGCLHSEDRLDVLFLMAECGLRLGRDHKKYLEMLKDELIGTTSVDCDEIVGWANDLSDITNQFVGWIHLYEIARFKMMLFCGDMNRYAEWIISPSHEFGLKCYDLLKCTRYSRNKTVVNMIKTTVKKWEDSVNDIDDPTHTFVKPRLAYAAKFQCRNTRIFLSHFLEQGVRATPPKFRDHIKDLKEKYDDPKMLDPFPHKVYSFALINLNILTVAKGAPVSVLKSAVSNCQLGLEACNNTFDFVSEKEKNDTIKRFLQLREEANEILELKGINTKPVDNSSTNMDMEI